jgi:carboxymethylenebutenolidase
MKRLLVGLAVAGCWLAVSTWPAGAQDVDKKRLEDSPRHHEWVKLKTKSGREVGAWVVFPEVKKPATAVVVVHEIFGLTDWVRSVADQLAEAGYIAIAPDLLSQMGPDGKGTDGFKDKGAVMKAIRDLPRKQVNEDLDAAYEYVRKLKSCNKKVAVGGFCWGGGTTFAYATHNPEIVAGFVFYGPAPSENAMKNIKAPVYGFYGEMDNRINSGIPEATKAMKALDKKYDPVIYDGAGHGFMRMGEASNASAANRNARDAAWKRWKEILKAL